VSNVLWRQRELLELLLFKLEEEQLVLASGRTRWLAHAAGEVEAVLEQIRETEMLRAVEVETVAAELSLPTSPSLRTLIEHSPAPWDGLLRGHREAFLNLTSEITTLAEANRDLLVTGQRALQEALTTFTEGVETYDPTGRPSMPTGPQLVDEAL
jgi:PAS domain-containing protein